jgi:tRNA(adenine34) deaminase
VRRGAGRLEYQARSPGACDQTVAALEVCPPFRHSPHAMILDVESPLEPYMRLAIREAEQALAEDEVPIGCVIVKGERVIAAAHNQREQLKDPTAHAEMIAITQAAAALGDWRLEDCALYVTLEPCPMCAGAILQARIPVVVYGASDPKAGAAQSLYQLLTDSRLNHRCLVFGGILAAECGGMLTRFFQAQRKLGKK